MTGSSAPHRDVGERVAARLHRRIVEWRPIAGGYTAAKRWLIRCADGSTAFVKCATDDLTAAWLRREHTVYRHLHARFLPDMLAWDDDGAHPFLVLEDLSAAIWPTAWTDDRVAQVLELLQQVAATPPPPSLPTLESRRPAFAGWAHVAADPAPFLRLRLCGAAWLEDNIGALVASEAAAHLAGNDLVHGDVRSDNLCFLPDRVVLIDWNWACRGNGRVDLAAWLPSLRLEGGPPPESVLPDEAPLAAMMSGYFAARAGRRPTDAHERRIRAVQLAQLRVALPWVIRALALSPPRPGH